MSTIKYLVPIILVATIFSSACQPGAQATPTPIPTNVPPTNTPLPPTETPTPTATPQTYWRDDFQDAFSLDWTWIEENPAKWSLTENPGYLRIYAAPYADGGKNILLLLAPTGDFSAVTHMFFDPDSNYQFAGLTLYLEDANIMKFGRAYCTPSDHCVGNGIYFDHIESGGAVGGNFSTWVESSSDTWLKLERIDTSLSGYYSPDGNTWMLIGTHVLSPVLDSARIGLFSAQDFDKGDADIPAVFDFFELTLNP